MNFENDQNIKEAPRSKAVFVTAQVIKFGLPLGLVYASMRVGYFYFLSSQEINADVLVTSAGIFVLCLIWGAVPGAYRLGKMR